MKGKRAAQQDFMGRLTRKMGYSNAHQFVRDKSGVWRTKAELVELVEKGLRISGSLLRG